MAVNLRELEYKNYGKCVELSNGTVKLIITVDSGPRIINYSFDGGENVMFEDIDRKLSQSGEKMQRFGTDNDIWYIYGGHRMWTSPEVMPRTYYPDNEPVKYEKIENGVRLVPPVQKWNQYAMELEVTLVPDGTDVKVLHRLTNCAAWDIKLAVWALTVLAPGGLEIVPQPTADTAFLPNRQMAFWSYAKLNDERVCWGDKYITLRQDSACSCPIKFGINSEHGYAMYFNHGDLFVKKFDVVPGGEYPDGGMSFETYTYDSFLEMESLGEYNEIAPGKSVTHCERWSLYREEKPREDESEYDRLAEKYVR